MRRLFFIFVLWTASVVAGGFAMSDCGRGSSRTSSTPAAAVNDSDTRTLPLEQIEEVTIPRGTSVAIVLDGSVGSATSHVDEHVRGHLTRPIAVNGAAVLPAGTEISGAVIQARRAQTIRGRAQVGIRFDMLRMRDESETYAMRSAAITRTAPSQMKKDTMKVAIPAAAGIVLGGVLGGDKGAVIGGAVGGGAAAGYVMSQRGPDVVIGAGTPLTMKLVEPLKVHVRRPPPSESAQAVN